MPHTAIKELILCALLPSTKGPTNPKKWVKWKSLSDKVQTSLPFILTLIISRHVPTQSGKIEEELQQLCSKVGVNWNKALKDRKIKKESCSSGCPLLNFWGANVIPPFSFCGCHVSISGRFFALGPISFALIQYKPSLIFLI